VTVSLAEHAVQRISAFKDDPQEESLEIPPEDLIALSESIGDVIVPHDDTKGTFLRLEKIPNKAFKGYLSTTTSEAACPVTVRSYNQMRAIRLTLEHPAFRMDFDIHEDGTGTHSVRQIACLDVDTSLAGARIVSAFSRQLPVFLSSAENGIYVALPVRKGAEAGADEFAQKVDLFVTVCENIQEISRFHERYLRVPEVLSHEDVVAMNKLLGAVRGTRWRLEQFHIVLPQDFPGRGPVPVRFGSSELESVSFLGETIEVGYPVIESTEAVVANYDELQSCIRRGVKPPKAILESRTDGIYRLYDPPPGFHPLPRLINAPGKT
jgi:hypothetical protein